MADLKRVTPIILLASVAFWTVACSSAPPPAPTQAPARPAATTAAQPTTAPAAAPSTAASSESSSEIVIGVHVPATGGSSSEGPFVRKAVNLAAKQINDAGGIGGKKIKLADVDNQSSNPGALAAVNKSVEQDKATAIIGPLKSTMVQAISDTVKKFNTPVMIGATNANLTKQGNQWLFRCRPDDSIAAYAMVRYVKDDLKLTKIGVLHDIDAFGAGGAELIDQYSKSIGGVTVVKREGYTSGTKDYSAQLLSLKNAGAEVMLVYAPNFEDVAVVQRQYRQLNMPYKYIGSPSSGSKDTLNLAKEASEGLMAIADYVPGSNEVSKQYSEAYKKEYNEAMDPLFSWNYDAMNILAVAMKSSGTNRDKIRETILGLKDYKGVLGTYSFTPNGDGLHEVGVVQIENGGHKLLRSITQPSS